MYGAKPLTLRPSPELPLHARHHLFLAMRAERLEATSAAPMQKPHSMPQTLLPRRVCVCVCVCVFGASVIGVEFGEDLYHDLFVLASMDRAGRVDHAPNLSDSGVGG